MALSSGSGGKGKSSVSCPPRFSLQQVKLRLQIGKFEIIFNMYVLLYRGRKLRSLSSLLRMMVFQMVFQIAYNFEVDDAMVTTVS